MGTLLPGLLRAGEQLLAAHVAGQVSQSVCFSRLVIPSPPCVPHRRVVVSSDFVLNGCSVGAMDPETGGADERAGRR